MKSPFAWLYDKVLLWSVHPKAPWFLAGVSFSESSFFPVPPDVMLAPMTLAQPNRWVRLALITTLASVAGGILGYLIGAFSIDQIKPVLESHGYMDKFEKAEDWFATYGFWAVFIAGFSPIPYKVFTIAAGATGMLFPVFVAASAVGRGARFFLVAGLVRLGGAPFEARIRQHINVLGVLAIVAVVALVLLLKH
ncbi:MAG: YqaA family protein [Gammaproteobacteria bacterium]